MQAAVTLKGPGRVYPLVSPGSGRPVQLLLRAPVTAQSLHPLASVSASGYGL